MLTKSSNGLSWLEFSIFQPFAHLKHAFFTVNSDLNHPSIPFDLNLQPDEDNDIVTHRLERIQKTLKAKKNHLLKQVHGSEVQLIFDEKITSTTGDALITSEKYQSLMIKHADCQAALFYDPVKDVIANTHCGWKGSNSNIYAKVIHKMKESFGTHPKDLLVGIGPSLGPKHAEFINYKKELTPFLWQFLAKEQHIDFWRASKKQLIEAGIHEKNIEIAQMCTYELEPLFFSYRKTKTTLRNAAFIALTD